MVHISFSYCLFFFFFFSCCIVSDDAQKSIGWNASDYGDGFWVLKRKERTVKGDQCNPTMDPLMVKSVFSLEKKEGKL